MAGEWIKMRLDLADDPAVIGIAADLELDEYAVVGRLHKLWSWADRQSRDGHAASVTEKWIDRYVERDGFSEAMSKAGWLKVNGNGISFPNFDRHNGESAKKRGLAANRQRNARVLVLSRSKRDISVTREEKSNTPVVPVMSTAFETFWRAWPKGIRKGGKSDCWKLWRSRVYDSAVVDIVRHVEAMKLTHDWVKDAGQYVPAPKTYLNQRKWEGADLGQPGEKRMVM